jgi:hypothetical protein
MEQKMTSSLFSSEQAVIKAASVWPALEQRIDEPSIVADL